MRPFLSLLKFLSVFISFFVIADLVFTYPLVVSGLVCIPFLAFVHDFCGYVSRCLRRGFYRGFPHGYSGIGAVWFFVGYHLEMMSH